MTQQLEVLMNAHDWGQELCPELVVLDPDGWDRMNLEQSLDERVSRSEFLLRLGRSTVRFPNGFDVEALLKEIS